MEILLIHLDIKEHSLLVNSKTHGDVIDFLNARTKQIIDEVKSWWCQQDKGNW